MLKFKVGNILESESSAIVNTVNCEGKMGKGLAFQFKKKYPEMEKSYVEVCKTGELRPGKLHIFFEQNKYIINFPTKNKWREKTKVEYISDGLKALKKLLIDKEITSVAIPPLGCGNGGLNWNQVKPIIIKELDTISSNIDIEVYEPSDNISSILEEPKADYKTLFLLKLSLEINDFKKNSLNQAVQLSSIISNNQILISDVNKESKKVSDLKKYYSVRDNEKLYKLLKNKLVSNTIEKIEKDNQKIIDKVCSLINNYSSNVVDEMISELMNTKKTKEDISDVDRILIEEGIISYNLFNEKEINYLT